MTSVRGDAAADLYNQGIIALTNNQYDDAAKAFDTIINSYPTYQGIDDTRIRAGLAYLYATKYPEAIDRLAKEAAPTAKPEFRSTALYFTSLAQFSQGQKTNDNASYTAAIATLTTLIGVINTAPTPDNKGFLESSIYYRALAYYLKDDYDNAEKDLLQVIQLFPSSLSLPDYNLRLGSVYAVETNQAVTAKKPAEVVLAAANKALAVFDKVSTDPNALVQANEANMSKGEILFLVAQINSASDGYEKALQAYRLVRRKDDMIPIQQARLDQLRKQVQAQAASNAANGVKSLSDDGSMLIIREEGRLKSLQDGSDPIIQALIRIAECYISITNPDGTHDSDEARTILHRLSAHAKLTADQQQEVDFQTLFSYALGGQTDQADKALTVYLTQHAGDPQADSISYQIAGELLKRKDNAGALKAAQRSLSDFPKGRYAADVIGLEAQALTRLGRIKESAEIVDKFLQADPTNPKANTLLLTRAQNETASGDLDAAAKDYLQVSNNAQAGPVMQAGAYAGYIQTLNSQKKYDDVLTAAKDFETKYPTNPLMPSVLLFQAMAMDQKNDPAAIAALQDIAKKYPKDDSAPFALFFVVNIYERANNVPAMIQAATDLRTAYPAAYPFLVQAADAVSTILIKQKKFDDAIALYQPLADLNAQPDIAATANNKIANIWLTSAHSMGYLQSMPLATRAVAEKTLTSSEQAYLTTLKKFPDQLAAVGDAFDGLTAVAKQRRSWGELKDPDMEPYLAKLGTEFADHEMQTRFELAEAGLVFVYKDGAKQYATALDRFKKAIYPNHDMPLTRQEANQFGELLLAAQDYPNALKVYTDLQTNAPANDQAAQGDALYGLGATALGQGDLVNAKLYFTKLRGLNGGGMWHPHILDAEYGIAFADESSTDMTDLVEAKTLYSSLMQAQGNNPLVAKAMVGYGRLLEKAGYGVKPAPQGPNEFAIHYYQEPNLIFDGATPAQSAEGLYDAGQIYQKAADSADNAADKKTALTNAKQQYETLINAYKTTAPDWAAKAQPELDKVQPELFKLGQ